MRRRTSSGVVKMQALKEAEIVLDFALRHGVHGVAVVELHVERAVEVVPQNSASEKTFGERP